ncbi:hypothetical protein MMC28_007789 [Mycoblastus sanguinarius]|nr:hypothetical protein [Mycoblastus sanguinarius]
MKEAKAGKQASPSFLMLSIMRVSAAGRLHTFTESTVADHAIQLGYDAQLTASKTPPAKPNALPPKPWTNPRKRPHNHESTHFFELFDGERLQHGENDDQFLHIHKKSRAAEWPLKNSDEPVSSAVGFTKVQRKPYSPRLNRYGASSTRLSKFAEGSMNDKISQRPPSLYMQEEAIEKYHEGIGPEDTDVTYDAGIESNKPSGMFRFGKALANAFNPVTVWQGINGIWKEKDARTVSEEDVLQERQAKAAIAYAELKRNGYKGTQVAPTRRESQDVLATKYEDSENYQHSSLRDSGIELDGYRSSSDHKDRSQFIPRNEGLIPPHIPGSKRSASPFSDASSDRRSSLHLRKPSFQGLKTVRSQIQLPLIKRQSTVPAAPLTAETEDLSQLGLGGQLLKTQPSRKDIAKQNKLSKKVSDLENKLEIARRDLELSLQDAPLAPGLPVRIGRRPFKPGALSSLPSERILTPQDRSEDAMPMGRPQQGVNNTRVVLQTGSMKPDKGDVGQNLLGSTSQLEYQKQGSGPVALDDQVEADVEFNDGVELEAAKQSMSRRKRGRPGKSQEVNSMISRSPPRIQNLRPKVPSKTPQNSPLRNTEDVPPIPAAMKEFNPSNVDQAKILEMRTNPNQNAAFGKVSDDMINLSKEFPNATEAQLNSYFENLPVVDKTTKYTSVKHPNRSASPFLGQPHKTSPMKTRSRTSKRGISPPPPSLASAKKIRAESGADEDPMEDVQLTVSAEEKEEPFATKVPQKAFGKTTNPRDSHRYKVLSKIRKEEFQWPDDVF